MDEETQKQIAQQLRKPEGEMGIRVAEEMNLGNRWMNRRTLESLNAANGDNILEIGMGNGFFVKDILSVDNTIKYTGCDYSALMVEEARKLNKQFVENGQAQFYFSNADSLPFDSEKFNKIFTVNRK